MLAVTLGVLRQLVPRRSQRIGQVVPKDKLSDILGLRSRIRVHCVIISNFLTKWGGAAIANESKVICEIIWFLETHYLTKQRPLSSLFSYRVSAALIYSMGVVCSTR